MVYSQLSFSDTLRNRFYYSNILSICNTYPRTTSNKRQSLPLLVSWKPRKRRIRADVFHQFSSAFNVTSPSWLYTWIWNIASNVLGTFLRKSYTRVYKSGTICIKGVAMFVTEHKFHRGYVILSKTCFWELTTALKDSTVDDGCPCTCYNTYTQTYLFERPPLWSSGQSSWLQIRTPRFDSRHYQKKT
jgi:hypothetical protein